MGFRLSLLASASCPKRLARNSFTCALVAADKTRLARQTWPTLGNLATNPVLPLLRLSSMSTYLNLNKREELWLDLGFGKIVYFTLR